MCEYNQTATIELVLVGLGSLNKLKAISFFLCFLAYVVILAGNFLIIGLIAVSPKLHTPMYFFLCNLSSCEIIFTSTIMPNLLYVIWEDGGFVTLGGCISQFYLYTASGIIDCLLLTVMAFDRYLAICYPLQYSMIMTLTKCVHLVVWVWLSGFLSMSILIVAICKLHFCGSGTIDHLFCDLGPILKLSSSDTSVVELEVLFFAVTTGILPFALIVISYVSIFATIMKMPSKTRRQKTFSTCSSHLASVCTYFGSIFVIYLVPFQYRSAEMNKIISLFYIVVTPLLNPIIYSLRNREIKICFGSYMRLVFKGKQYGD